MNSFHSAERNLYSALLQWSSRHQPGTKAETLKRAVDAVSSLIPALGYASQDRRAQQSLGRALIAADFAPKVWVTSCPDYSHANNGYTFEGVNGGVSRFVHKHAELLDEFVKVVPTASVIVLYADQEARDESLQRAFKVSRREFEAKVRSSVHATNEFLAGRGWHSSTMNAWLPGLAAGEETAFDELTRSVRHASSLRADAKSRQGMYRKINPHFTEAQMLHRSIKTAAQYLAFARLANDAGAIVCNHTSVNLRWFQQEHTAILHNPVETQIADEALKQGQSNPVTRPFELVLSSRSIWDLD